MLTRAPKTDGYTRPMTAVDLEQVASLYASAFNRNTIPAGFGDYVQRVYFDHPDYSPEIGCQVFEASNGVIKAAIFSLPMRFQIAGQGYVGSMIGSFMRSSDSSPKSIQRMVLRLRPRNQDLAFVCSANLRSMNMASQIGSSVLPIHSLKWRRVFRPGNAWRNKLKTSQRPLMLQAGAPLLPVLDPVLRRLDRGLEVENTASLTSKEISLEEFRGLSQTYLQQFSVRPDWTAVEFNRIAEHANGNAKLGERRIRCVLDENGEQIGAYIYFWGEGRHAKVFDILSARGHDTHVVHELLAHLDGCGCTMATGRAQPYLMPALSLQRYVDFRHLGHVAVSSRHPEVVEAIRSQSVYLGGYASEDWNQLLTGF